MKTRSQVGWMFVGMLVLALPGALLAASPPGLIHYQGVLRSAADAPLTGTYDMVFSFFDVAAGGDPVLVDTHDAAGGSAVVVTGGLFSVPLGGGTVTDGSGPGTYSSLEAVFQDHTSVYVEVRVGVETLAPRTQVLASAYALHAATAQSAQTAQTSNELGGQPSAFYLDTSPTRQAKYGTARFQSPDTGYSVFEAVHTGGVPTAAGYFEDNAFTGRAWLAGGNRGIQAYGSEFGGYFESTGWGARVYLAMDSMGLEARPAANAGACAGRFIGQFDGASHNAILGCNGGTGVDGYGNPGGHFLSNWGGTGEAYLGYGDEGVHGYGTFAGGFFVDTNSSSWVRTSYSTYKVQGSGSVSFVQNHPYDKGKVIVYAAPEGDEVAVYTRGTARLVDGEARVKLGETFALVANPDVGLSANVTPIGDPVPLAVVEKSTSEIVVRGPARSDVEFDYIVWGLRIGFESQSIVQPKTIEAAVPAMTEHEASYAADPSLRGLNALERFKGMRKGNAKDSGEALDLTRAGALLAAIGVYDPARDGQVEPLPVPGPPAVLPSHEAPSQARPGAPGEPEAREGSPASQASEHPAPAIAAAPEARPWLASFAASGVIEAGDVVVLDPLVAGAVKRCDSAGDRGLVGVAAAPDLEGTVNVAVATILDVLVDAELGAVAPGDLLTTSATPGAAMRSPVAEAGTILGKALEPLDSGVGTIRVLLMPR